MDVCVVTDHLYGLEIKSDEDTLKRLPTQAEDYNDVCRYLTLVVGEKHLAESLKIIPEWWGVTVVKDGIKVLREPQPNPSLDSSSLIVLLWKSELCVMLARRSSQRVLFGQDENDLVRRLDRRRKAELQKSALAQFSLDEIEAEVCMNLKRRLYRDKGVIDCWTTPDTATPAQKSVINASDTSINGNDCSATSGLWTLTGR